MTQNRRRTRRQKQMQKWIFYPLQAVGVYLIYLFFRCFSIDRASWIGAAIGRFLGRTLAISRKARRNIELAFPEKTAQEHQEILTGMWDNLGRVMAEYAHLQRCDLNRFEVVNLHHLDQFIEHEQSVFFISGHFANWEMFPVITALIGLKAHFIYRHANNPYTENLMMRIRKRSGVEFTRKGVDGARQVVRAIKEKIFIGLLVDQKDNRGISVPFMGRDAMTGPAVAALALHYHVPIIMTHVERIPESARFKVTVEEPFYVELDGQSKDQAIMKTMTRINARLEDWIRLNPAQWLWLHRRWGHLKDT